jgi:hypothetical protein
MNAPILIKNIPNLREGKRGFKGRLPAMVL